MRFLGVLPNVIVDKTVILCFAFALMASCYFCQGNIAEAGANIGWKTTSVSISPGKATIYGYFYNTGNARAAITKFEIWGYIAQYKMNSTFSGSNITVGSLGAGNKINWSFTILEKAISYSDSSPRYNFNSRVTWN